MDCSICGISELKTRLFDGLSEEGIIKICKNCADEQDIFLLKRPTSQEIEDAEKKIYSQKRKSFSLQKPQIGESKENISLKEIINENFKKKNEGRERVARPDLMNNFHWIIMRARRQRKLSRSQLAKAIGEAEPAIELAEKGIVPEDENKLISKLQAFLGVRLIKPEYDLELKKRIYNSGLSFDPVSTRAITLSDLKKMQEKENFSDSSLKIEKGERCEEKEVESFEAGEKRESLVVKGSNCDKEELKLDEDNYEDLSLEEIDKLLFRKK
jgi:ribosome-binding protein aMBF1 (putative translation factor)